MNWIISTYLAYLAISIALTVWVARTLHKNGRIFLVDSFLGNEQLADSVNHLLVVGFYLMNIGYVALALKHGVALTTGQKRWKCSAARSGWSCWSWASCTSSIWPCSRKCGGGP